MKRIGKILWVIGITAFANVASAQNFWDRSEIGFSVGGMKYIGGEPNPSWQLSAGLLGKYLVSDQFSIRFQLLATTIASNKGATPTVALPENKEFKLNALEISILPEYDLININDGNKAFTPYVFAGLGYFYYTTTYRLIDTTNNTSESFKYPRSKVPHILSIPIGAGIKYAFSPNVKAFAEGSFRLYFHQELYSFAVGMTFNLGMFRGNGKSYETNDKPYNSRKLQSCPPVYL